MGRVVATKRVEPILHCDDTTNGTCVIPGEMSVGGAGDARKKKKETDPKRMPPKAANEAMMIVHANEAVEMPSAVPVGPPAMVVWSKRGE